MCVCACVCVYVGVALLLIMAHKCFLTTPNKGNHKSPTENQTEPIRNETNNENQRGV